jgi:hypothetical protein
VRITLDVASDPEIEPAFATFVQRGAGALLIGTSAFLNSHRERTVSLGRAQAFISTEFSPDWRPIP